MLAAVGAALGFLAPAQPSEAKIVYTPTKVVIKGINYNLDLNHDGITDFTIEESHIHTNYCKQGPGDADQLIEGAAQGNGQVETADGSAAALASGVKIGPNQNFTPDYAIMGEVFKGWFFSIRHNRCLHLDERDGDWVNVSHRYLGLEFQINGKTHYGWARLRVQVGYVYINATLTGYAYETTPGKSIKAGQTKEPDDSKFNPDSLSPNDPGSGASLTSPVPEKPRPTSLGMLAIGAQGVPLWRRKASEGAMFENNQGKEGGPRLGRGLVGRKLLLLRQPNAAEEVAESWIGADRSEPWIRLEI